MPKKIDYFIYFLTILSIFLSTYVWGKINLPYTNLDEVLGYYSSFNYSHYNDTIKYLVFVGIPLVLFFLLCITLKKKENIFFNNIFKNKSIYIPKKNIYLNFTFFLLILLLIIKFFTTDFFTENLDVFHEGQQLSGAYNFFITKEIWKNTYVISGLFMDIFNANIAWYFTGQESIGAYRFYIFFIQSFTSIIFLILSYNISKAFNYDKDKELLLFLVLSCFSLYLINSTALSYRDLPLALSLILILSILKSHEQNLIPCLTLGFLNIISLLWSLDRGIYLNVILIFFFFVLMVKKRNFQIFYILLGVLLSWLIFYSIIGKENFLSFLNHSFTVLKYMDLQHGIIYPTPFSDETNASRGTKNLLIIIINGIFVISSLLNKKNKIPTETKLFLGILFVLSFVFYKSGLSRSDGPHLKQAISYHLFLFIIFIYYHSIDIYKKHLHNEKFKFLLEKYSIFLLIFIFLLQNNINFNANNIINFKERYNNFIKLDNSYFLIEKDREVINRLKNLTKDQNCFQSFSYHTAFTYLVKKKSCSKFTHIFNIGPKKHQFDYINEMKKTAPKYILYEKKAEDNEKINDDNKKVDFVIYSFIRPSKKFIYINKYILENYDVYEELNDWFILIKKN